MTLISNAYARIVTCTRQALNGASILIATIVGMRGSQNQDTDINIATPQGFGSIPPKGRLAVVVPMLGSNKSYAITGFVQATLDGIVPHNGAEWESWLYSKRYALYMQNDAIRAYRMDDQDFNATLPIGESFVAMMLNRINEMQTEINYLKTVASTFNNHVHSGVMSGAGTSAVPTTTLADPPKPATLDHDKTYLQDGKALINDTGEVYT